MVLTSESWSFTQPIYSFMEERVQLIHSERNTARLYFAIVSIFSLEEEKQTKQLGISLNCKVLIIINSLFISWTIVGFL